MKYIFKKENIFPFFLLSVALIDAGIRIQYLGLSNAITQMINDPGKLPFHIVLLPLIAYFIVSEVKLFELIARKFKRFNFTYRFLTILISILLISGIFVTTANDLHSGFCFRVANPQDVKGDDNRKELLANWLSIHKTTLEQIQKMDENKIDSFALSQMLAYKKILYKVTLKTDTLDIGKTPFYQCEYFLKNASTIVYLDWFLTFLGAFTFTLVLFALLIIAIEFYFFDKKTDLKVFRGMFNILCIIPIWILLKDYSECYNNFFSTDDNIYDALRIILIVLIFVLIILVTLFLKQHGLAEIFNSRNIYYIITQTLSFIGPFSFIKLTKTGLIYTLFCLPPVIWVIIYIMVVFIILIALRPPKQNKTTALLFLILTLTAFPIISAKAQHFLLGTYYVVCSKNHVDKVTEGTKNHYCEKCGEKCIVDGKATILCPSNHKNYVDGQIMNYKCQFKFPNGNICNKECRRDLN